MSEVSFRVQGHRPIPWGSNEMLWRGTVATEARRARERFAVVLGPNDAVEFAVDLRFRMTPASIERADVDNLAKPVLDTIFLSRNAQVSDPTLTGALFPVDDDRVFRLHIEKRMVPSEAEEGVDIRIFWQ